MNEFYAGICVGSWVIVIAMIAGWSVADWLDDRRARRTHTEHK